MIISASRRTDIPAFYFDWFCQRLREGYLNKELGEKAVTARLDVRYRKPVPIGAELVISSWVESRKGSFVSMKGSIALPDGTIAVEGSGKLAIVEQAE